MLFAPDFARPSDRGGYLVRVRAMAAYTERDGTRRAVSALELVSHKKVETTAVLRHLDPDRLKRADMRARLCHRLGEEEARDRASFEVVAQEQTWSTERGELLLTRTVDRIVVDLGCGT